jgi:2-polyprenyl-6-hydroxyphenyl methylase/3-demethylubiquinone-9 3-methyltransferase
MSSTIDPQEIEKFSKIADEWWSTTGKFKPLHKFNPIRISFIRNKIIEHFALDQKSATPFLGLKILDVGCGGGLIAEPFARMNAQVTAIDASEKNIKVAKIHAEKSQLKIDYRASSVEDLIMQNEKFDVVLALEVVEHVVDLEKFITNCAAVLKPNGLLFVATINRTLKSLALAKVAVEYILRWLPAGTHDWKKFLKPSEINFHANNCGLTLQSLRGFSYNILTDEWKESEKLDVNYAAMFLMKNPK